MNVLVLVNVPENFGFLFRIRVRLRARLRGVLPPLPREARLPAIARGEPLLPNFLRPQGVPPHPLYQTYP